MLRRLAGLDPVNGDLGLAQDLADPLQVVDLALAVRPIEVCVQDMVPERVGPLDAQAHGVEPVHEFAQGLLGDRAGFLVALHHDQLDVQRIDADLLEEPQVVVVLAPEPRRADPRPDANPVLRDRGRIGSVHDP